MQGLAEARRRLHQDQGTVEELRVSDASRRRARSRLRPRGGGLEDEPGKTAPLAPVVAEVVKNSSQGNQQGFGTPHSSGSRRNRVEF